MPIQRVSCYWKCLGGMNQSMTWKVDSLIIHDGGMEKIMKVQKKLGMS